MAYKPTQITLLALLSLGLRRLLPRLSYSGRVDRVSATETVESGSIPGPGITKDYKNWYSQLPCLTFSNKRDSVKPPPCVGGQVAA